MARVFFGKRPKDKQQQWLYRAEFDANETGCQGRKFETITEIQDYVDELLSQRWFRNRFGVRNVKVYKTWGGTASAQPLEDWIRIPPCFFFEEIVLHEITHHIQPPTGSWHGSEFCAILLYLVERRIGFFEAAILRKEMQNQHCSYNYSIRVLGDKPKPKAIRKTSATR